MIGGRDSLKNRNLGPQEIVDVPPTFRNPQKSERIPISSSVEAEGRVEEGGCLEEQCMHSALTAMHSQPRV